MNPVVLFEDNHCLALDKPAGMPTQGDDSGDPSLVDWAREDLRVRHRKPGNVFVGLVHRLDRPVSGVVLLGRTSKGAGRLSAQFREGTVEKRYWAIVEGAPEQDEGTWSDLLVKDERHNVVTVGAGGKQAELSFRVLDRWRGRSLVEVRPASGRSHQIRVQLSSRGMPILGDLKYGSKVRVAAIDGGHRVALHARSLKFRHPTRPGAIEVVAPVPPDWPGSGP
ncbi:RluA family pseudouridine synthase [Tautonia plasticadhaerens]|uniref:Ribosomal large subunit pseudouridine synthase C n=1 Tax=Tautonia plasticadhaerens TaxID=2527974 RepID=A0A518HAQ6_9BACT|nr:RluA family pseudouridine synthase [Tautonia plasticadhaerens]QDV37928.1 Ribosomal large subunit pseudouridine synthase C [Tautonia plasticadhaerens]